MEMHGTPHLQDRVLSDCTGLIPYKTVRALTGMER